LIFHSQITLITQKIFFFDAEKEEKTASSAQSADE